MKLTDGEVIVLSNNKEYICMATKENNGKDYVLLMSNFKPLEVKFAEQIINGDKVNVRIINNQEEKIDMMKLFDDIKAE